MVNGEPWFVAADVCSALALSNVSQAVSRLDSDEQRDITIDDVTGRPQMTVCINKGGSSIHTIANYPQLAYI
jgi:prophage antirepressor-like protein